MSALLFLVSMEGHALMELIHLCVNVHLNLLELHVILVSVGKWACLLPYAM